MSADQKNIDQLQATFEQVASQAPQQESGEKFTYSYNELYDLKDVEVPFLIHDLIPANSCVLLFGEDGIGKTMLSTQLCMHIALKYKTFLNMPLNVKHHRAMVVATETAKTKFIRAAAKQHKNLAPNIAAKDVALDFLEGYGVDDMEALKAEMKKMLKLNAYDLIVVDVVGDLFVLMEGDINNNTHARQIVNTFQKICEDYETTILLIHHVAKTKLAEKRKQGKMFIEKDDQIGAGALTAKPRAAIALSNNPKSSQQHGAFHTYDNYLHVVKMNEGGRTYVQNALRCSFDTSTLLHNYKELIDIATYEAELSGNPNAQPSQSEDQPFSNKTAYTYEEHRQNIISVFGTDVKLTREDLIKRMKATYAVGSNRIEQNGGILQECMSNGLIGKDGRSYVIKVIPDDIDKAKQLSLDNPDKDEDAPF